MVDICLAAIKECVGRFPHFYKGLYRLAHYYYHSKVNRNIEACRELLLGRPQSASIVLLQQQQGVVQVRFLPTGVAGLFTEWRYINPNIRKLNEQYYIKVCAVHFFQIKQFLPRNLADSYKRNRPSGLLCFTYGAQCSLVVGCVT